MPRLLYGLLLVVLAPLAAVLPAQTPAAGGPLVEIVFPDPETYLTGPVVLRANVDPASAAQSVSFSVDGREVCTIDGPPFECEWDAGSDVVERQVRLVTTLPEGGRVVRTVRTKGLAFAEKVDVDVVQVTVTVTNDRGEFVPQVPRSAFQVLEDGKPQTITYFASEDVPIEMVVAVDISGSMSPSMPKLKEAVKSFLRAVPPRDPLSLLAFNDTVFALTRRPTETIEERFRAVDRIAAFGATALYDVIVKGIETLKQRTGRKALIVFSDGEDQGSHVTLDQVEQRLQASDVTLYMISQGRGLSVDRLKRIMERLVSPTGGRVFAMESIDELSTAFEALLEELSHQYLLGYPPTSNSRDGKWHEISVRVDGYRNVRARQGYRFAPTRP